MPEPRRLGTPRTGFAGSAFPFFEDDVPTPTSPLTARGQKAFRCARYRRDKVIYLRVILKTGSPRPAARGISSSADWRFFYFPVLISAQSTMARSGAARSRWFSREILHPHFDETCGNHMQDILGAKWRGHHRVEALQPAIRAPSAQTGCQSPRVAIFIWVNPARVRGTPDPGTGRNWHRQEGVAAEPPALGTVSSEPKIRDATGILRFMAFLGHQAMDGDHPRKRDGPARLAEKNYFFFATRENFPALAPLPASAGTGSQTRF